MERVCFVQPSSAIHDAGTAPHNPLEADPHAPVSSRCRQERVQAGVEILDIPGRGLLAVGIGQQEPQHRSPEVVPILMNDDP